MTSSASKKTRLRWWCLVVSSTAVIITGLQNTITNVALPSLQQLFQASATMTQWFVNSYILTFASLLLLMGFVGDKYGRKRTMNVGLIVFLIGSIAAALSETSGQFLATQVVMGAGAAMLVPQTLSILVDTFPAKEKTLAIAIWTGVAGLGSGLGPLIGGFLLQRFPVSSVFTVNIPLVLLSLALGYFVVFESKDEQARRLDLLGTVYSAIAIITITFAFIAAPGFGWLSWPVIAAFAAGVASLAAFVRHENRFEDPLLDLGYFRDPRFTNGVIGISVVFFALMGMMFLATQYMQTVREWSALKAGLVMLPMAFLLAIGSVLSKKLVDRLGNTAIIVLGVVWTGIGMTLIHFWDLDAAVPYITLSLAFLGMGVGLAMGPSTNEIMTPIPADRAGQGSSINTLARQVSGAIGIAILGSVLNSRYISNLESMIAYLPPAVTESFAVDKSEAARSSVARAFEISRALLDRSEELAGMLLKSVTAQSFTLAMGSAMIVGAVLCFVTAVVVLVIRRRSTEAQAAPEV